MFKGFEKEGIYDLGQAIWQTISIFALSMYCWYSMLVLDKTNYIWYLLGLSFFVFIPAMHWVSFIKKIDKTIK